MYSFNERPTFQRVMLHTILSYLPNCRHVSVTGSIENSARVEMLSALLLMIEFYFEVLSEGLMSYYK